MRSILAGCGNQRLIIELSHAQQAATAEDFQVLLEALEATPPLPASAAPAFGNFWNAQQPPPLWPPVPMNFWNLPVWSLGDGSYIINDLDLNYSELTAEAEAAALLSGVPSSGFRPWPAAC